MSSRASAWAWEQIATGRLPGGPSVALVLLKLSDRADPEGRCWPGHETTAKDCAVSKTSAKAAIAALAEHGLLQVERHQVAGRDTSNTYLLLLPPRAEEPGEGANSDPRGSIYTPRGTNADPESKRRNLKEERKRERTRARTIEQHQGPKGTAAARWAGGKATAKPQAPAPEPEKTEEGIWHFPGDPRDREALARIRGFESGAVAEAVAEALTSAARAWPSAVLAILLSAAPPAPAGPGGWERNAEAAAAALLGRAARSARSSSSGSRPEHCPAPPPQHFTPAQAAARAAARLAAAAKLTDLKKKMGGGK